MRAARSDAPRAPAGAELPERDDVDDDAAPLPASRAADAASSRSRASGPPPRDAAAEAAAAEAARQAAADEEDAYLFISRLPPLHLCTPAGREPALPPKAAHAHRVTLVRPARAP
jgi:hypothetical protein